MSNTAARINDIGPEPQSFDIERATKDNTAYRSVAWSGRYLQVTLMSIPAGGDIGLEAHPETDQFLRLDAGSGRGPDATGRGAIRPGRAFHNVPGRFRRWHGVDR